MRLQPQRRCNEAVPVAAVPRWLRRNLLRPSTPEAPGREVGRESERGGKEGGSTPPGQRFRPHAGPRRRSSPSRRFFTHRVSLTSARRNLLMRILRCCKRPTNPSSLWFSCFRWGWRASRIWNKRTKIRNLAYSICFSSKWSSVPANPQAPLPRRRPPVRLAVFLWKSGGLSRSRRWKGMGEDWCLQVY